MDPQASKGLLMLAVLRYSDKSVIAFSQWSKNVSIEGVRECVASNALVTAGRKYSSKGDEFTISYTEDAQGRVYALVAPVAYPPRVAFLALEELAGSFGRELGLKAASATENSLSKAARPIFDTIAKK